MPDSNSNEQASTSRTSATNATTEAVAAESVRSTASLSHSSQQVSSDKEKRLRKLYKKLDTDGDGHIDIKDLTAALKQNMPNVSDTARSKYATRILHSSKGSQDVDSGTPISFAEFVHYVEEHEKKLALVFKNLDKNEDGIVDVKEIRSYFNTLGLDLSISEAQKILIKMNADAKHSVDLDDFKNYLMLYPSEDAADIMQFWRHYMVYDIGEDMIVPDFTQKQLSAGVWKHLVAGGLAGAVSRTSTAPLDRLKVFLQVYASRENKFGLISGMRCLLSEGGARSLWRGNGINVLKIAPESAMKFMAYEKVMPFEHIVIDHGNLKRLIKGDSKRELFIWERFIAGSAAGSISQTCIYPLEVLKTRLALRRTNELNEGLLKAAVFIYQKEGLHAFYRGYLANLLGIIPYSGIDLAIYETLKSVYAKRHKDTKAKDPGILVLLGCGTTSSICGQLTSYPLALIRTRLQARGFGKDIRTKQPNTITGQFRFIMQNEGFFGLYRGLVPNFLKVLPSVGISYVVYETIRKQLGITMT